MIKKKLGYRFYYDVSGDPRSECENPYELLGHFLGSDVQGSISRCKEILQMIDEIYAGKIKAWQQTGNAHTITLSTKDVCIKAEFNEDRETCRLTIGQFQKAIADWMAFLEK